MAFDAPAVDLPIYVRNKYRGAVEYQALVTVTRLLAKQAARDSVKARSSLTSSTSNLVGGHQAVGGQSHE
jgi:hypothetical protein